MWQGNQWSLGPLDDCKTFQFDTEQILLCRNEKCQKFDGLQFENIEHSQFPHLLTEIASYEGQPMRIGGVKQRKNLGFTLKDASVHNKEMMRMHLIKLKTRLRI